MYHILLAIHIITCIFLISTILLQAGRGGGLTDSFGGGAQSLLGSQAPAVLKKATEISAIVFLVVSLLLAMFTARRGKSLFQQMNVPMARPAASTTQAAPVSAGQAGQSSAADVK